MRSTRYNGSSFILTVLSLLILLLVVGPELEGDIFAERRSYTGDVAIVGISPIRDNTLYEDPNGSLSNGAGSYLFAGRTGPNAEEKIRRGLIAFDVAGNLPADAVVISATLRLNVSKVPISPSRETFSLHRLTMAWGEGTSDAGIPGGDGATATAGDATWLHAVYSPTSQSEGVLWTIAGGDFVSTASASTSIYQTGLYAWGPTAQMTADVRSWLDSPKNNHGWLILGNESETLTARRFDSKESPTLEVRPMLRVKYIVPGARQYLPFISR